MRENLRQVWTDVFPQEVDIVKGRHAGSEPVEENLVGLAISGGGIRSATFALGVLEGLKRFGLLSRLDYLSTVSGGGYIGAWLSANCKRCADRRLAAEADPAVAAEPDWLAPLANWDRSVDHLRRYSNYLSPTVGFFSADTWSMVTIWLRNTILVQLTVILAIAVALFAPRPLFVAFRNWPMVGSWRWMTILLFITGVVGIAGNQVRLNRYSTSSILRGRNWPKSLILALICLGAAWLWGNSFAFDPFAPGPVNQLAAAPIAFLLVVGGFWLQPAVVRLINGLWPGEGTPRQINYTQGWAQGAIVVPMLMTGFLVGAILWGQSQPGSGELALMDTFGEFFNAAWRYWPFPLSVVFVSLWVLSFCSIRNWREWTGILAAVIAPFPAMLVLHVSLSAIMLQLHGWAMRGEEGQWFAYMWAPPMVLYSFALTIVILIGILGRQSSEGVREWWSRLGAWLSIYGMGWMLLSVFSVYGPKWSAILINAETWKGLSVSGAWIGTTLAGLLTGKSGATEGGKAGKAEKAEKSTAAMAMEWVAAIAPFVFIAGLLVTVSTVIHLLVAANSGLAWHNVVDLRRRHWMLMSDSSLKVTMTIMAACLAGLILLAARVDINEFSLNAFYRSRLVRCYLGATRFRHGERNPQNFTGFDDDDDLALAALAAPAAPGGPTAGPLHIINCALNLGGSSDLALHTRHSAEFTLTPIHCGSRFMSRDRLSNETELGYVPTAKFGGDDGQPTLGQAISVSGAAASPNMGYHTSPVVAFLLTVFNVRLGWWFPNPAKTGVNSPSPWFSLRYLLTELFGGADDKSKYLNISDGGHFENLAAYELIKRRCRVIIISDGECDPDLRFEGLGTLIRMCEVDFNAKITIDVESIRPAKDADWSRTRCAVGRIDYRDGSPEGTLIYLKASMSGHEDTSVLQYKSTHDTFPHESTGDQFYGEDQFESYRTLGRDIALRAFEPVADEEDFVAAAHKLRTIFSPSLHNVGQFTELSSRLTQIWSDLRGNPDFHFLDRELVSSSWPADSASSFRATFYLCNEMLHLMENVFLVLRLEDTWRHPDNEGWRAMFEHWAKSPAIQNTWTLTAATYGLRFQYFCNRHLSLPLPEKGAGLKSI